MKRSKLIILLTIFSLSLCNISCSKKKSKSYLEGKEYINLMEEDFKSLPDPSLQDIKVILPKAKENNQWLNSAFNQVIVPNNILVKNFNPTKQKTYAIYKNKTIFGSDYTPIIDNNILYAVDNKNTIHAFDLAAHKTIWKRVLVNKYLTPEFAGGGITKHNDILIVTYGSNSIAAIEAKTGEVKWQYELSNIARSSPAISKNSAYILTIDNKLYCLDLLSGIPKWTISGAVEKLGIFGSASPAISEGKIVTPHSSGQLLAVNAANGNVIWDISLIKSQQNASTLYLNDIDMTPLISDGIIYIGNYTGALFALDLNNGAIKWINDTAGGTKYAWETEDFIFTVNKYSQLVATYKLDGLIKWSLNLSLTENKTTKNKRSNDFTAYNGPIMINDKLYINSSNGKLFEIDPDKGKLLNQYLIPKDIYTPPIVVKDKVYLFNNNGNLTVIN